MIVDIALFCEFLQNHVFYLGLNIDIWHYFNHEAEIGKSFFKIMSFIWAWALAFDMLSAVRPARVPAK